MATVTFDTLAYSNRLQKSGVPKEQADAMAQANAEAFRDMTEAGQLATKQDLAEAKHEILKCMVTAMIAQTALLVGIIAFLK